MDKYLGIDEDGYITLDGNRVEDEVMGRKLLENLSRVEKDHFVTNWDGVQALVENYDEPLVAKFVEKTKDAWFIICPYGFKAAIDINKLCVDEKDRFHGLASNQISFVFSRHAQAQFFDMVEEFDDDSITIDGKQIPVAQYFIPTDDVDTEGFWDTIYQTETPGWEIGMPAKPLQDVLAQLKLAKSKILVAGCGSGEDAAYLAGQGHLVTAVDFSEEAIKRAKEKFPSVAGLTFMQADLFDLDFQSEFDVIFEHACYAAIPPDRRDDLIALWRRWLKPGGHLLGIFFMMAKRGGPPFGNSEWMLKEKLRKTFRFLYWTRWRHSIERRKGRELVVYAQKL
jgi:SAM-dependent methyltransferase